jgi:hypothetical protein
VVIQKLPIRSRQGAVRWEGEYLFKNGTGFCSCKTRIHAIHGNKHGGGELGASLRASRQGAIRGVTVLEKGIAIVCAPRLAADPLAISLNHYFIPYTTLHGMYH